MNELIRRSAVLIKDTDGRIGIQMRDGHPGIIHPLTWSLFGGAIDDEESPVEAAIREFREELDVEAGADDFRQLGRLDYQGADFYVFEYKRPLAWRDFAVHEGAGIGFFHPDEIMKLGGSDVLEMVMKAFYL